MSEKTKIIESVPGIEQVNKEDNQIYHGQIVRNVDFKGDPRRVLGHPSNPNTDMLVAYSERLASNDSTAELGKLASVTQVEVIYDSGDETPIDVTRE